MMSLRNLSTRYGLAIAALLLSAAGAWAQVTTANLAGTVQDASGAVVPGAPVTLTNDDTGLTYEAETGPAGGLPGASAVNAGILRKLWMTSTNTLR